MTIKSRLTHLEAETMNPETLVIFVTFVGREPVGWQCDDIEVMRLPGESASELNSRAVREAESVYRGRPVIVFRPIKAS